MGRIIAAILACLFLGGCLLPDGTPVYIDGRNGKLWSGNGVLLGVNEDRSHCRVAARNRALVVEKKWVDCRAVHPRMPKDL